MCTIRSAYQSRTLVRSRSASDYKEEIGLYVHQFPVVKALKSPAVRAQLWFSTDGGGRSLTEVVHQDIIYPPFSESQKRNTGIRLAVRTHVEDAVPEIHGEEQSDLIDGEIQSKDVSKCARLTKIFIHFLSLVIAFNNECEWYENSALLTWES